MTRAFALAIAVSLVAPTPALAQVLRGTIEISPSVSLAVPSLNTNAVPQMGTPSLSPLLNIPLSPSLSVPSLSLAPAGAVLTPVALKPLLPAAVKPSFAVPFVPSKPAVSQNLAVLPSLAQTVASLPAASVPAALFDGASAKPAASVESPSVAGSESVVPSALKPSARPELTIASAAVKKPSRSKVAATSAMAWWRLSGIVAPLAALFASIPQAFHMTPAAWLAVSALWVAGPAAWSALPKDWKRVNAPAAVSAALVAGVVAGAAVAALAGWSLLTAIAATAALGVALSASTASFGALERRLRREPTLLHVDGKGDERRLWIEPAKFGKLMLMTAGIERGLGEKDIHAARTDSFERAVYFKRTGDFVELVARDLSRRAAPGSTVTKALAAVYSDATIGKAKIIAEDPVTGALAVDLKSLALQDFFSLKPELEGAFAAPYALDPELSSLTRAEAFSANVEIGATHVYEREAAPEDGEVASRLPDARRVTLSVRLSFSTLPEAGYRTRLADPRVGHFTTMYEDWTDDRAERPTVTLINRWRLEKTDPSLAVSPVKSPIVYWLDPSIPARYRDSVVKGVLAWNEAFEKAGYQDAIVVKDAPEGMDLNDARRSVIRWFVDKDANYAIGQTRTDPVTGEIYQATLGISALHPRAALGVSFKDLGEGGDEKTAKTRKGADHVHTAKCGHAAALAKQAQMTLAVLEARGGMNEEQKERFVQDYVVDLTLHEVGHTLGLRHNFLAKTWKEASELTGEAPIAASVMDYLPANVAPPGAAQGSFWNTKLGPYDFWAIEYAYKAFDAQREAKELKALADRAGEPGLAYATDEDQIGLDPDSRPWYIGKDALEWARGRLATVRELWKALEKRVGAGTHTANYRAFVQGWRGYLDASRLLSSIVGGMSYRRNSGDAAPFTPVSGARRRAALALIEETVFSDAAFDASPELRRRLDPGREGTVDDPFPSLGWLPYDELTLWLRQDALARLLDPELMALLAEAAKMAPAGDDPLTPRELIETLTTMIWREVIDPGRKRKLVVSPSRRRLQEAHLNMLILLAYRSAEDEVPEVSALARAHLTRLSETLAEKSERKGWDAATRDHIKQAVNKIDSADSRYEP